MKNNSSKKWRKSAVIVLGLATMIFVTGSFENTCMAQETTVELKEMATPPPPPPPPAKVNSETPPPPPPPPAPYEPLKKCQKGEVDKTPEYKGGMKALKTYFVNNLKYPKSAAKNGISGTVYVSFVVKKDGSVAKVKIKKGIDKACDDEALRIVKLMPKWSPGEQDGKPVEVEMVLPVSFNWTRRSNFFISNN